MSEKTLLITREFWVAISAGLNLSDQHFRNAVSQDAG